MRFTIFFGKYVVGAYLAGVVILSLANVVDFVLSLSGNDKRDDKLRVSALHRLASVFLWPFYLFSRRGRGYLAATWRNVL